jgi:hypothetical protein
VPILVSVERLRAKRDRVFREVESVQLEHLSVDEE